MLNEVRLTNLCNELISHYQAEFKKKFHVEPSIGAKDHEVMRWLLKTQPVHRGKDLLAIYLSTPDEWFMKQSYSLACFQMNINKVLISQGLKERQEQRPHIAITFKRRCDGGTIDSPCSSVLDIVAGTDQISEPTYCEKCLGI